MHDYINTQECREMYFRTYFGDSGAEPCGHCDNCLKPDSEYKKINAKDIYAVMDVLNGGEYTVVDLQNLTSIHKKKVVSVLRHLIQEEKATTNPIKPGYYSIQRK